ncbi:MAG: CaiB/BaiF CoA-transferase family protein [Burkholderiaceae bacterium]
MSMTRTATNHTAATPAAQGGAPLRGVRILDLTRLLPGPMCTLHLADLGADVIKIEDTGAGDYASPPVRDMVNRNKRGIRIDLKHPQGRAILLDLCANADVLVEGFRPGVMERLGVGWQVVRERNPRLVYCSISGYGQTGPLRDEPGHDMNYSGLAGVADQIGGQGGMPGLSNVPVADLLGGTMTAVMGILAALYDAARTGTGRHVDIAIADGLMAHAVLPMAAVHRHGRPVPVGGDRLTGSLPCYAYYPTADGRYLAVGALERKFWDLFCERLERPDLKERHAPASTGEAEQVRQEVAAILRSRPLAEWTAVFADAQCCVTPVLRMDEAIEHPQFKARGMTVEVPDAQGGRMRQLACPVRMDGFEFQVRMAAPEPGQHTDEVLFEIGCDAQQVTEWRALGAIR